MNSVKWEDSNQQPKAAVLCPWKEEMTEHQIDAKPTHKISPPLSEWLRPERQEITSAGEVVEKREPSHLLVGRETGAATVENSVKFPR